MHQYTEKQLEEADIQITERKDRETENWPRREGSASRKAIERTSNLIKAAGLLGGRYSPGRIDLPCGRYVWFNVNFMPWEAEVWITPSWNNQYRGRIAWSDPIRIASMIRKMLVEHDEYLLTNPQ